jgi:site-specific DNA recombinase
MSEMSGEGEGGGGGGGGAEGLDVEAEFHLIAVPYTIMEPRQDCIRCVIYVRISADLKNDEHGVTNQTAEGRRYADARGWTVIEEYTDNDISATYGAPRPGYEEMMRAAARGEFDMIVIFQTSRLWRNRKERAEGIEILRKAGVSVQATKGPSLDMSTAYGRGMAGLIGEFDTMETEVKSERQELAAAARADDGQVPMGVRLMGYTVKGELVDDEVWVVRKMFRRFHAGASLREIARWLDDTGMPARQEIRLRIALTNAEAELRGQDDPDDTAASALEIRIATLRAQVAEATARSWNPSTVRTVLRNPRYCGRAIYQGEANGRKGRWTAIVDEAVFDAVNAKLSDPRRRKQVGTDRKHLGSGLYLCGVCDHPLRAHTSVPAGGVSQLRYRCPEGGHVTRSGGHVDRYVLGVIRARLARPDLADLLVTPATDEARGVTEAIGKLRERLDRTKDDYDNDLIDGERYRVKMAKLAAELDTAEAARVRLLASSEVAGTLTAPDPVAAFDGSLLGIQRAVITFFMTVRLDPAPRGRKGFDPASVRIEWRQG